MWFTVSLRPRGCAPAATEPDAYKRPLRMLLVAFASTIVLLVLVVVLVVVVVVEHRPRPITRATLPRMFEFAPANDVASEDDLATRGALISLGGWIAVNHRDDPRTHADRTRDWI